MQHDCNSRLLTCSSAGAGGGPLGLAQWFERGGRLRGDCAALLGALGANGWCHIPPTAFALPASRFGVSCGTGYQGCCAVTAVLWTRPGRALCKTARPASVRLLVTARWLPGGRMPPCKQQQQPSSLVRCRQPSVCSTPERFSGARVRKDGRGPARSSARLIEPCSKHSCSRPAALC